MSYISLFHQRSGRVLGTLTHIRDNVVALPVQLPQLLAAEVLKHPTRLDVADPVVVALQTRIDQAAATLKTEVVDGIKPHLLATGDDIVLRLQKPPPVVTVPLDDARRRYVSLLVQAQGQALDSTPDEPYTGSEAGYKGKGLTKNNVQMDKLRKTVDAAQAQATLGADLARALMDALRDFDPAVKPSAAYRERRLREMHHLIAAIAG